MKIYIRAENEYIDEYINIPRPSKTIIPEWYKNMPNFIDDSKTSGLSKESNIASNRTMKGCVPFLDAMTSGYTFVLPADIEIVGTEQEISVKWRTNWDIVSDHSHDQHPTLPAPIESGESSVMKWVNQYIVTTPAGYSTIFTHPLNRHDLPFRTFTGIVDTDVYDMAVQFPFQIVADIRKNERLIIEEGTPVCQIIPFKRDSWEIEKEPFNQEKIQNARNKYFSKIVKAYKSRYWHRKDFR